MGVILSNNDYKHLSEQCFNQVCVMNLLLAITSYLYPNKQYIDQYYCTYRFRQGSEQPPNCKRCSDCWNHYTNNKCQSSCTSSIAERNVCNYSVWSVEKKLYRMFWRRPGLILVWHFHWISSSGPMERKVAIFSSRKPLRSGWTNVRVKRSTATLLWTHARQMLQTIISLTTRKVQPIPFKGNFIRGRRRAIQQTNPPDQYNAFWARS